MEPVSTSLVQELHLSRSELLEALSGRDFYIEWTSIGIALLLAWLLAVLIRQRVEAHIKTHPPRRIDSAFIMQPLKLLAPLLALIYLGVATPIIAGYGGGMWIAAVVQITLAYLLARCVMLLVRTKFISYLIAGVILVTAVLNVTGFMPAVTAYLDTMAFEIGKFRISLLNFIHGAVILVIVFWLAAISSRTLESYLRRSSSLSYTARELTVKFFRIFVYFIALMITLSAVGVDLTAFAVFGGALGVGLGFGLQKIAGNFISGITLLVERSIKIGDIIEVGGSIGTVRELNVRYALIETPDGRELMIPNDELASTRVINWTHSNNRMRIEIPVGVAYDSDVKLVKNLLLQAAKEHPLCLKDPEPKCWLRTFGDSSLNFILGFWVSDVREGRFGPQSDVMFAILEKFRQNKVEIPFPQRVVHTKNG